MFGTGYAQQWTKCNDKLLWGSVYPTLLMECGEVNLLLRVCRRPKIGLGLWEEPCGLAVPIHAAGIWCCAWRWICSAMETHMLSRLCMGPLCGKLYMSILIHAAGIWCCAWRWICSAIETHMLSRLCMGPLCGKLYMSILIHAAGI